jgi:hypothetical protein
MGRLIEQGLKPGNVAYDEQLGKLRDLEAQTKANVNVADSLRDSFNDLGGSLSGVGGNLKTLFDAAGLKRMSEFAETIVTIGTVITTITTLIANIGAIGKAIATVAAVIGGIITAIVTAPLWAIVAGLVAIGATILGVVMNWDWLNKKVQEFREWAGMGSEEQKKKLEEERIKVLDLADAYANLSANLATSDVDMRNQISTIAEVEKTRQNTISALRSAVTDGLKESIAAFTAGAENYGQILREKLKVALGQAIIDNLVAKTVTAQFDKYFVEIADNIKSGMDSANSALVEEMLKKLDEASEGLGKVARKLFEGVGAISPGAANLFSQAMNEANKLREQHASTLRTIYGNLERGNMSAEQQARALAQARVLQGRASGTDVALARGMATGGLVTGPTFARMGEGGRNEAVLPLNENVYRQIGQGIAAARGGAGGMQLVVNYTGSGKWTREDAQGLGRMLVSELRSMGVRA